MNYTFDVLDVPRFKIHIFSHVMVKKCQFSIEEHEAQSNVSVGRERRERVRGREKITWRRTTEAVLKMNVAYKLRTQCFPLHFSSLSLCTLYSALSALNAEFRTKIVCNISYRSSERSNASAAQMAAILTISFTSAVRSST